jgi:hypothetical protein
MRRLARLGDVVITLYMPKRRMFEKGGEALFRGQQRRLIFLTGAGLRRWSPGSIRGPGRSNESARRRGCPNRSISMVGRLSPSERLSPATTQKGDGDVNASFWSPRQLSVIARETAALRTPSPRYTPGSGDAAESNDFSPKTGVL